MYHVVEGFNGNGSTANLVMASDSPAKSILERLTQELVSFSLYVSVGRTLLSSRLRHWREQ